MTTVRKLSCSQTVENVFTIYAARCKKSASQAVTNEYDSKVIRISRPGGRTEIQFPANWHQIADKKEPRPKRPYIKRNSI